MMLLINDFIRREKGIEYVHVFGIDNILAKPIDPLLLGFSDTNDFDITCKFISKV